MHRLSVASALLGVALGVMGCSDVNRMWNHATHEQGARVDLNTASARELRQLPGVSKDEAQRIVANRPYENKGDLLRRNIVDTQTYNQIEDRVYAGRARYER